MVPKLDLDNGVLGDEEEEESMDDNSMQAALAKALGVKHPKEVVTVDIAKELEELHLSVCGCVPFCWLVSKLF